MKEINSAQNETIKNIVKLLQKSKARKEQGLFVVDGLREIKEGLEAKIELQTLLYCPELAQEKRIDINEDKVFRVSLEVFRKVSYKENPDGFLSVFKEKKNNLCNIKLSETPLVVVLEAVEKPGNLGAIIRTAYASGVDLIIINDNQTDIYNPNVIRASEGKIFSLPVIGATQKETVDWLKENNIKSLAATTAAKQVYFDSNFKEPLAIILGSEDQGLSTMWLEKVDEEIKIPMQEGIDSLNVSVAAAVILFEVVRQRSVD